MWYNVNGQRTTSLIVLDFWVRLMDMELVPIVILVSLNLGSQQRKRC